MKKITTLLSMLVLTVSIYAQNYVYYEGRNNDLHELYKTYLDSNFVDSLTKYHLGGVQGRIVMNNQSERIFGAQKLYQFSKGAYTDTSLFYIYIILTGVDVNKQFEVIAKLNWERNPIPIDSCMNRFFTGWDSTNNCLQSGIIIGTSNQGSLLMKAAYSNNKLIQIDPKSIYKSENPKNYW